MHFEEELARALPLDIPNRDRLIRKGAEHLKLIAAASEYMNLTRITDPQEAAIKHVFDSVAPWRYFQDARRVLDAGSGAGFPGIPLAIVLPNVRFALSESIQKKARFLQSAVDSLELANVEVFAGRAEELLRVQRADIVTARAVAPTDRLLDLFEPFLKNGTRLLLYKGPQAESELREAEKHLVRSELIYRYELPDGFGGRSLIEVRWPTKSANAKAR